MKKRESKENVPVWRSGQSASLYRSRSMDVLPQREPTSTRALCALFESKANPQPSFNSSHTLHSTAAGGGKTREERPLPDRVCNNTPSTQVQYKFYKTRPQNTPSRFYCTEWNGCMHECILTWSEEGSQTSDVWCLYHCNQEPASQKKRSLHSSDIPVHAAQS